MLYDCARPSTPIHEILEFKYQDEWIEKQQRLQMARLKEIQAKVFDVIFKSDFCCSIFSGIFMQLHCKDNVTYYMFDNLWEYSAFFETRCTCPVVAVFSWIHVIAFLCRPYVRVVSVKTEVHSSARVMQQQQQQLLQTSRQCGKCRSSQKQYDLCSLYLSIYFS